MPWPSTRTNLPVPQLQMIGAIVTGNKLSQTASLDTRLGLNTASETDRCQFDDSTEVIYSDSNQKYDSWQQRSEKDQLHFVYL